MRISPYSKKLKSETLDRCVESFVEHCERDSVLPDFITGLFMWWHYGIWEGVPIDGGGALGCPAPIYTQIIFLAIIEGGRGWGGVPTSAGGTIVASCADLPPIQNIANRGGISPLHPVWKSTAVIAQKNTQEAHRYFGHHLDTQIRKN